MDPDLTPPEPSTYADGVMVISAWSGGVAGGLLARITMGKEGATPPDVRVVTDPDDLHRVIDEWLESLGGSEPDGAVPEGGP
jgi:hypothetical protein